MTFNSAKVFEKNIWNRYRNTRIKVLFYWNSTSK